MIDKIKSKPFLGTYSIGISVTDNNGNATLEKTRGRGDTIFSFCLFFLSEIFHRANLVQISSIFFI